MRKKRTNDSSAFIDTIKKYIELKAEYYQLSFTEKVGILVGKIVLLIFTALLGLVFLLLLMLLIYNFLMDWIGIAWVVTLIEIGFLALVAGILWIFREKLIINPIASSIIRSLLDSNDDHNKEEDEEDE